MKLICYIQERKMTIVLTGEIDHHCAKEYIMALKNKIEIYVPTKCILDFTNVSFMDSSGIAVIINAMRFMQKLDGELYVSAMQNQPKRVFMASGMDKLIKISEECT